MANKKLVPTLRYVNSVRAALEQKNLIDSLYEPAPKNLDARLKRMLDEANFGE